MATTQVRYDKENLENAVKSVEKQFPEQIERIRYSVGEDWAGEPAIFFRVLLKDEAIPSRVDIESRNRMLLATYKAVTDRVRIQIQAEDFLPYFSFRTVSGQEELRDPKWD